jgi:aryl-alcohol dehydrogenase-like predicted oxidoreductase
MQKRRLGRSDLYLTPLALGTWAIGGRWAYGCRAQDDAESVATIGRALDLGVGWIDTGPAYGLGHAETLVGQAIRGRRDEIVIAPKCGLVWDDPAEGRVTNRLTAASIEKEADDSLKRLGIESRGARAPASPSLGCCGGPRSARPSSARGLPCRSPRP